MFIGRTSGGSPIYYNVESRANTNRGKTLYACSADERHKLTKNQARSSGYRCTHCGADLKVRKEKIKQLEQDAKVLGLRVY